MNSKILIVVSDYYKDISSHLCEGAIRFLKENIGNLQNSLGFKGSRGYLLQILFG